MLQLTNLWYSCTGLLTKTSHQMTVATRWEQAEEPQVAEDEPQVADDSENQNDDAYMYLNGRLELDNT